MQRRQETKRRRVPLGIVVVGLLTLITAGQGSPAASWAADVPTIDRVEIGLGGRHKVGYWTPVRVELSGVSTTAPGQLELVTPDSEGLSVTYVVERGEASPTTSPGGSRYTGYVKFGRTRASLTVRWRSGREVLAERRLSEGEVGTAVGVHQPLLVTLRQSVALDEAARQVFNPNEPVVAVTVAEPGELPDRWFGYEGVHTLVVGTSDLAWLKRLSSRQNQALDEWLRLGGRMVISAGRNALELQAHGAPWAGWFPGEVEEVVELRRSASIESFAAAEQRLLTPDGDARLPFAVLKRVRGRIDAVAELAPQGDRPVVVTYPVGFGQAVFVAVDIDEGPVAAWPGRSRFLAKLLQSDRSSQTESTSRESQGQVTHLGFDDLSGQLRSALDQFPGVTTIAFGRLFSSSQAGQARSDLDHLSVGRGWFRGAGSVAGGAFERDAAAAEPGGRGGRGSVDRTRARHDLAECV